MKLIITIEQANKILSIIGKFPAAKVIDAIDILRTLPSLPEPIVEETKEELKEPLTE